MQTSHSWGSPSWVASTAHCFLELETGPKVKSPLPAHSLPSLSLGKWMRKSEALPGMGHIGPQACGSIPLCGDKNRTGWGLQQIGLEGLSV